MQKENSLQKIIKHCVRFFRYELDVFFGGYHDVDVEINVSKDNFGISIWIENFSIHYDFSMDSLYLCQDDIVEAMQDFVNQIKDYDEFNYDGSREDLLDKLTQLLINITYQMENEGLLDEDEEEEYQDNLSEYIFIDRNGYSEDIQLTPTKKGYGGRLIAPEFYKMGRDLFFEKDVNTSSVITRLNALGDFDFYCRLN